VLRYSYALLLKSKPLFLPPNRVKPKLQFSGDFR